MPQRCNLDDICGPIIQGIIANLKYAGLAMIVALIWLFFLSPPGFFVSFHLVLCKHSRKLLTHLGVRYGASSNGQETRRGWAITSSYVKKQQEPEMLEARMKMLTWMLCSIFGKTL